MIACRPQDPRFQYCEWDGGGGGGGGGGVRGYGFFTFCLSPVGNAVRLPGRKNPQTNFFLF